MLVKAPAQNTALLLETDDFQTALWDTGLKVNLVLYQIEDRRVPKYPGWVVDYELVVVFPDTIHTLNYGITRWARKLLPHQKGQIVRAIKDFAQHQKADEALKKLGSESVGMLLDIYNNSGVVNVLSPEERFIHLLHATSPRPVVDKYSPTLTQLIELGLVIIYTLQNGQQIAEITGIGVSAAQKVRHNA